MRERRFTDPLGSKLPALEQNVLKYRAMEMLLVLYYVEELKRDVLDHVQTTDRLVSRLRRGSAVPERVPKGTKNSVDKALDALVADRAITAAEKMEIVKLIDYRNIIGHEMHNLLVDVNPRGIARDIITYTPELLPKYNHEAVVRLRHFLDLFDGLYRTHYYATELRLDRLLFRSAENTFLAEIKRLDRKISRLVNMRRAEIKRLNAELSLGGTGLEGDYGPQHPLCRYGDGRLTKRGVEICYRLFDNGKSPMAVAHLTGLSLNAARKRRRMWEARGGASRIKADITTISHPKICRRYDD